MQLDEQSLRRIIREELDARLGTEKNIFERHIQILDGRNILTGKTTGTIIASTSTEKLGVFGKTPVIRQAPVTDPTAQGVSIDQDAEARTAISSLITRLIAYGWLA